MTPDYWFHIREVRQRVVLWKLSGAPNVDEWEATLRAATLWLCEIESRGQCAGVVVDTGDLLNLDSEIRRLAGEWRAEQMPLIANTLLCASYVAPSPFLRGAIRAVFWFARPVIPVTLKPTLNEACDWVEEEVRRTLGSRFPPS